MPGPHDFAVRNSAVRLAALPRPSHPALHVRDDASAPPDEPGTALALLLFLPKLKAKYFLREHWTATGINVCELAIQTSPTADGSPLLTGHASRRTGAHSPA